MEMTGSKLEFISIVLRDGSGTKPLRESQQEYFKNLKWELKRLSATEDTFLAFRVSVCVVKIRK